MRPPERLIPEPQMVAMLTDLALLNAARTTNGAVFQKTMSRPMPYLFEKYGVDSLQFVESDRYYASLPDRYEDLYRQVKERIEARHADHVAKKERTDSLRTVRERAGKNGSAPSKDIPSGK